MPYRNVPIVSDQIYHIFNRGIASVPTFSTPTDFLRFLDLINYYRFQDTPVSFSQFKKIDIKNRQKVFDDLVQRNNKQVEIMAFCLMDNHFHFLLKQLLNKGIARFISNLQNGYAKYFNIRINRSGPLFQPMFKSVRIITDEQLLHASRYIHLNPSTGYLVEIKDLEEYPWSSLSCYIKDCEYQFISTSMISEFMDKKQYKEFVFDQASYQRELGKIKHLMME